MVRNQDEKIFPVLIPVQSILFFFLAKFKNPWIKNSRQLAMNKLNLQILRTLDLPIGGNEKKMLRKFPTITNPIVILWTPSLFRNNHENEFRDV